MYFNSTPSSGLTIAAANALYLQKTVPDTATAQETFSAGIITTAVEPIDDTKTLNIGLSQITGALYLGKANSRIGDIGIGTGNGGTSQINIGSITTSTNIYGLATLNSKAATNLDVAASQTTGVLNIGTGLRTIATGNGGGINIGTGSTVALPIAIGSSSAITTIGGALKVSTVDTATAVKLLLGTTTSSGVDISKSGATTSILGNATIAGTLTATSGISTAAIDANVVPLVIGKGLSSETQLGIASKKTTILGSAASDINILTGTIKCGPLTANSIDTTTAGLLTIGGANCTGVTFSDTIGTTTFTGAIKTTG
jgi:hypothetical protein